MFLLICYIAFIAILWRGLYVARGQGKQERDYQPFVSVIVPARNECSNIVNCLDALLNQDYPNHQFEVVLVDDSSTDCTQQTLQKFTQNQAIHILQNSSHGKYKSSKKGALEIAIPKSRGELLLFTDADCLPPPTWIKNMVRYFQPDTGLVAGFSPQQSDKKWLNKILEIDAAAAAMVSASTIGYGRGVTCTGRNLAYRKQAWLDIGGFVSLPDSLSGDDDFILQAISKQPSWKVKYTFDSTLIVPALGPQSIASFLRQKQRHISAGKYYSLPAKLGFTLYHFVNLMIWGLAIFGLFIHYIFILPLLIKLVLDFFILRFFVRHFNLKIDVRLFLLWQILFVYYNTVTGPIGFFRKLKW